MHAGRKLVTITHNLLRRHFFILKSIFIDLRERKEERNISWLPPVHVPTGDQTCNLGMCPDREWNPQPFGVWGNNLTNSVPYLLGPKPIFNECLQS